MFVDFPRDLQQRSNQGRCAELTLGLKSSLVWLEEVISYVKSDIFFEDTANILRQRQFEESFENRQAFLDEPFIP